DHELALLGREHAAVLAAAPTPSGAAASAGGAREAAIEGPDLHEVDVARHLARRVAGRIASPHVVGDEVARRELALLEMEFVSGAHLGHALGRCEVDDLLLEAVHPKYQLQLAHREVVAGGE